MSTYDITDQDWVTVTFCPHGFVTDWGQVGDGDPEPCPTCAPVPIVTYYGTQHLVHQWVTAPDSLPAVATLCCDRHHEWMALRIPAVRECRRCIKYRAANYRDEGRP